MGNYYTEYKIKVDLHELDKVRKKLKKCGFTFRYSDRIKWKKTKEAIRQSCEEANQSFVWIFVYVGEGYNDLLWDDVDSEAKKLSIDEIEKVLGNKKDVLEEPTAKSYKVK